jgi:hypothetical protein
MPGNIPPARSRSRLHARYSRLHHHYGKQVPNTSIWPGPHFIGVGTGMIMKPLPPEPPLPAEPPVPHCPFRQFCPAAHTVVQLPQCEGSVYVSVQLPEHSVPVHKHLP